MPSSRALVVAAVSSSIALFPQAAVAAAPAPGGPTARDELVVWLRSAPRAAELGATALADFDATCLALGATGLAPIAPMGAPRVRPASFRSLGLDRIVRVRMPAGADVDAAAARFAASHDVELAYAPGTVRPAKSPDDPLFSSQWSLQNDRIAAPKAWNIETNASGVAIAVIDSGADMQHADFKTNRWVNSDETAGNNLDDDGNGYVDDRFGFDFVNGDGDPDDDFGHGTQVSGVLGAVGDNGKDIAGVCWVADVMSLKILDSAGHGSFPDFAEAVIYAADNGALVCNMSLVSTTDDPTLRAAIDYARDADVVQVAAAGNVGDEVLQYPAAYDGVIGVIATDELDQRWSSSTHGDWCDLAAPGKNILSLKNNGGTIAESGTSFAAPAVAGVAALIRKLNGSLDRVAVELTLEQSSRDLGPAGFDDDFAWGRLDAAVALEMSIALTADTAVVDDGSSIDLHLHEPADGGFLYVLLPTTGDREPGIPLVDFDPGDARVLPLNPDWLQTWVIGTWASNPLFQDFVSFLDSGGDATATFLVPKRLWQGVDFDFAFVTIDPADLSHVVHLSEPCRIRVQ